ncbi:MAG TPA: prepilin-type N-terminal cleavage/methylation domain-containing protein [Candidatus Moranbacteria bacterium]|nr:prepilin-type N-terminal cleavage/methylation domain-containing protein [Candidatus Moranbacteria bacterium]HRY28300.1 prepilin-type N-terminal cleavage/methylation domain-containing protein [Candidatus Moranbacteria bacterium]HSA08072.1 prepilin-type N-terminal cleavage/methylation domain-containing protein [Candidatus Moranbacteria bacterium]
MIVDKKNNQKKTDSLVLIWLNKSARRGFSLIEVLITLLILTISITGVTFLMAKNIASVQNSKNQIIAAMLAQEGIELVRNLKDNKLPTPDCSNCRINIGPSPNLSITNNDGQRLYMSGNFYRHVVNATPTKFYRRVDVSTIPKDGTNETTVTSYVTWRNGGFIGLALPSGCTSGNKCVSAISLMPDLY